MPASVEIPQGLLDATCDIEGLHRDLAHWNVRRLAPGAPKADWEADLR